MSSTPLLHMHARGEVAHAAGAALAVLELEARRLLERLGMRARAPPAPGKDPEHHEQHEEHHEAEGTPLGLATLARGALAPHVARGPVAGESCASAVPTRAVLVRLRTTLTPK